MSTTIDVKAGAAVQEMCFSYHNPESINGPFGTIDLDVDTDGDVSGKMVLSLLFGFPSNTYLTLTGTCTGTTQHVCQLTGKGVRKQFGQPTQRVTMTMTLTMDEAWKTGTLVFGEGVFGVSGGLPVVRSACKG